jgi:hypothetical protein
MCNIAGAAGWWQPIPEKDLFFPNGDLVPCLVGYEVPRQLIPSLVCFRGLLLFGWFALIASGGSIFLSRL